MIYNWTFTADVSTGALQEWLRTAEGRPVGPIPSVTDGHFAQATIAWASQEAPAWLVKLEQEMTRAGLWVRLS